VNALDVSAVVESLRGLLFNGLQIITPPLLVSLILAVVVGVVQAVMQIQEQTLSFFPKLLALFAVIYWMGPWMFEKMVSLIQEYIINIPGMM
jgi:flagellar biosynthesis protein FliQ